MPRRCLGRFSEWAAPRLVTPLIAATPAKCDKQESTKLAERAGTSLTMSHFVLRGVGSALLSRRLKPALARNNMPGRWPEGRLKPITTPLHLAADPDDCLRAEFPEAAC